MRTRHAQHHEPPKTEIWRLRDDAALRRRSGRVHRDIALRRNRIANNRNLYREQCQ